VRIATKKARDPGAFSLSLEESEETLGREVPCILETDKEGKPFISEALPLDIKELSRDEVQLLYLQKSIQTEEDKRDPVLKQFFMELRQPGAVGKAVVAVEKDNKKVSLEEAADAACFAKKYKPVALKVKPVLGTLPERFVIIREITGDPLKGLPKLPEHLLEFSPKGRYMAERKEKLDLGHMSNFLWPEERKLMYWIVAEQNQAFAWEDNERGKFKEEYFLVIEIPTVAHILWVERPFRIPPVIHDKVCSIIKRKIDADVYKPSNSLYSSRWFCVIKKDGKSLQIVHSLEPLNRVTIVHSGLPPATEELAMHFAGRACGRILDLYIRYDERVLAKRLRDLTTFQTPFGALRLVTLPMGWTNSVPIFYDDVTYILRDEIPRYMLPYIDDMPIRDLATRYEKSDGTLEVLEKNPGIQQFIFEHMGNVNWILQRIKYAGGMFSGPKTKICEDHITIVGFDCSYKGRKPTRDAIGKIMSWGPCEDTTDIRAFLGMAVQCHNHIPNFVTVALPLYEVIKKDVTFEWGPVQEKTQSDLKTLIESCFHTRNPNFPSEQPLVLAVDTSWRAVGYYIYQRDEDEPKRIHYVKFNSLLMDER